MLKGLVNLPPRGKNMVIMLVDLLLLPVALWLAFSLRLGEPVALGNEWDVLYLIAPLIGLPVFVALGVYRAMVRYLGPQSFLLLFKAITVVVLLWGVAVLMLRIPSVPRSVLFIFWLTAFGLLSSVRMLAHRLLSTQRYLGTDSRPVVIYGAGIGGVQLASLLRYDGTMHPVGFLDDDVNIHGKEVNGVRVYAPSSLETLIQRYRVVEVLLVMPAISRRRQREILNWLEPFPVHVRVVPPVSQLTRGQVRLEDLREVELEDLLGREPVLPDETLLHTCITGKSVLVTGAGGSIGSELCRQIIRLAPKILVLYELSEYALYAIDQELQKLIAEEGLEVELVALLGSVQEYDRLERAMNGFGVETVYHAAAYKHVPLVEHNVVEGVRNNIFGTRTAAEAALACGVETFVLISTDKAVRPTNVMGATKRLAELVLQGLDLKQRGAEEVKTSFCMVRFGNVLGSSGSVVPLFRQQIEKGGPVTVTHPEIIRYFMTIPEASQLVIQAGAMASGGDVFVLDMGDPVRIVDLARKMIHLMGAEVREEALPEGGIAIEYTGLRPGEKLFEELLIGDNVSGTQHARIMRAEELTIEWEKLSSYLQTLAEAAERGDCAQIRAILLETVNGYQPSGGIEDSLWKQCQLERESNSPLH